MNTPLVSVIIPAYNYAHFLPETLDSVIKQTFSNWECILINDGSTDETEKVAIEYCKKDERIKYYYQDNRGLSSARNLGLKHSKGEYIQFLDADDFIHPEKFTKHLDSFDKNDELTVVYSNFKYFITETGKFHDSHFERIKIKGDPYQDFILNWGFEFVIPIHCPILKSDFIKRNNIWFDETLKAREDWMFWISMAKSGAQFSFIDEILSYYRQHEKSMVYDKEHMIVNTLISCFRVYENIPLHLKSDFENKYSNYLSKNLEESKKTLLLFQNSGLYRFYGFYKKLRSLIK
jgi:glycosyltransferase involved in cell wall biosynthesis